jgi:hypothetical protein
VAQADSVAHFIEQARGCWHVGSRLGALTG